MAAKIFRINYKSDFILTLTSDAGWMTPFCIKFWTGAPSQAYYVGWDGATYTHCAPVAGEPTKLLVQFDDHHLPIGDLKFQIAYHFTVADFPNDTEDEVINPANITTEIDGQKYQVMLDFTGETAPEIQFSLPAYANEAQRIANEQQRIANETQRIANEDTRIQHEESRIAAEQTRQQNEQQRINQEQARVNEYAGLKADAVAATGAANDAAALANQKAQLAADKAALAQAAADLANAKAQLAADKAALADAAAMLANQKAALAQQKAEYAQEQGTYSKNQGDYAKEQGDYSKAKGDYAKDQGDYSKSKGDYAKDQGDYSKQQGDYAKEQGEICAADHLVAVEDHQTATADNQTAAADHQTAIADHNQAGNDHTRAESDHTRAESDHAAVEVYVDSLGAFDISAYHATGGELAKYADLTAALGTNGANIPDALRKGGMSVKFVQSSDNKYVQYRLKSKNWSTNISDWSIDLSKFADETAAKLKPIQYNDVTPSSVIVKDKYIGNDGLPAGSISSNNKYGIYVVDGYDYVRFIYLIADHVLGQSCCFTDANDNLDSPVIANVVSVVLNNIEDVPATTIKEYIIKVPQNAYYFKCAYPSSKIESLVPGFNSNFYCYLGKGEIIDKYVDDKIDKSLVIPREKNCITDIQNNLPLNGGKIGGSTAGGNAGKWYNNNAANHYLIPLDNQDKRVIVKSNSSQASYISFVKNTYRDGVNVDFATGYKYLLEVQANEEIELIVPYDAKYLYLQSNTSVNNIPQSLIISRGSKEKFDGIDIPYTSVTTGKYINASFEIVSSTAGIDLYEYDVTNVKVIGIRARIGAAAYGVFYDFSDNIITYFRPQRFGISENDWDFNSVLIVPGNAVKLKFSSKSNQGLSVKNCVNIPVDITSNLLTCKKVAFIGDSITYGYGLSNIERERWTAIFSNELARCIEVNLGYSGTCVASNAKVDSTKNANRFITRATQSTIGDADVIFVFGSVNDFTADSKAIGDIFTEVDITPSETRGSKKRVSNGDTDTFSGALHELLNQIQTINKTAKVIYINILNKGLTAAGRPTGIDQNSNGNYLQDFNDTIDIICDFYGVPVIPLNKLFGQNWNYDDNTANPPVLHSMDADGVHPNALGHRRIAEVVFEYIVNNKLI